MRVACCQAVLVSVGLACIVGTNTLGTPSFPGRQLGRKPPHFVARRAEERREHDSLRVRQLALDSSQIGFRRSLARSTSKRRRPRALEQQWLDVHRRLVREVQARDYNRGWDVIFYGDAVFESTRGTMMGNLWTPFQEVKDEWDKVFLSKPYSSHALAIAGDGVKRLHWRLQNGELPVQKPPKVAVILVGSSDLQERSCTAKHADKVAAATIELLHYLHKMLPTTQLLYVSILPKGVTWPNYCSEAISAVNASVKDGTEADSQYIHFLDVLDAFLTHKKNSDGQQELVPSLMSEDTINLSFYGMRLLAHKLEPMIDELVRTAENG